MAKKRSQERHMQEMIELGKENAELLPRVKGWCKHIQIQMTSRGMLAQMSSLPIGFTAISCEHASNGGIESMHLRDVATAFILKNCRGCAFHQTVDIDNIGNVVLKEWEQEQTESKERAESATAVKLRLQDLITGDLATALHEEKITTQSVLELVAGLDDEKHHIESAKKLVRASEVAPEFFSDLAVEVICSHFPDSDHGKECISTIRNLAKARREVVGIPHKAALRCVLEHHNPDEASALLGDWVVHNNSVPPANIVDAIVGSQYHGHILGSYLPTHRDYPGSNYALGEIGRRDLSLLVNALKKRLAQNDKFTRVNAAHVIQALIDNLPSLAIEIIDPLIDSLELDDDPYEGSADATACQTLASIYVRHAQETQKKIEAGYERLSAEAKAELYSVYRFIVWGANDRFLHDDERVDPRFAECIPSIIPFLLSAINGFGFPIEVKEAATDALKGITRENPEALVPYLDVLLGTLTNLVQEESLLAERKTQEILEVLQKQTLQAQYPRVVRGIVAALEAVCELEPRQIFDRLNGMMPNLDSTQPLLARFKSELVGLYAILIGVYELVPAIIPQLYKFLMDFDSVLVRGAAVEALGKILSGRPEIVPRNMIEILIHYLSDTYVYVHKSTVSAIEHVHPQDLAEATEIAQRLYRVFRVYDDNPYYQRDVLRVLIHVTRDYPSLLLMTVRLVIHLARSSEIYVASDALEDFQRLLPRVPETVSPVFAHEVLSFLGRTERDRYNDPTYSDRYHLLTALCDLPSAAIDSNAAMVEETVRKKIKEDPLDALQLVDLLAYIERYEKAAELAEQIATAQPQTKNHEWIIREARLTAGTYRAEALVVKGEIDRALHLLSELAEEVERDANKEPSSPQSIIEALTVAQRIPRRSSKL